MAYSMARMNATKAPKSPKVPKTKVPKLQSPKLAKVPSIKPSKYSGKGTRARLNTAASKMMFNTKWSGAGK